MGAVEEKSREAEAEKGVTVIKVSKDETRAGAEKGAEKGADIEVAVKTGIETSICEAEAEAERES